MKKHASALVLGSFLVLVVVLSLSCGGAVKEDGGFPSSPHPVIVIAVDGLRTDHLGVYGGTGAETPAFDALAAESIRFEWAFAQASDPAVSMAGLLSGLYPTASGVVEPGDHLPDEAATIAEVVSAAGILTAAFLEGSPGGNDYGLAQGFDHFHLGPQPGEAALGWLQQHSGEDFVLVFRGWSAGFEFGPGVAVEDLKGPEGFYQRLQDVLASELEGELRDMEPGDLVFLRELYAARIRAIDRGLGAFMEDLRGLGLTDRATLMVLGTNGSDLEEHGAIGYRSLHATVARVPMFIRTPGGGVGRAVGEIVELIDVLPTLLDLVGLETPPTVQGTSVLPLARGEGRPPYLAFSESTEQGGQRAIALGGYRLLISKGDDTASLFNLSVDSLELDDVADTETDKVDVMRRHVVDWEKMVAAVSLDPELRSDEPLDPETLERLKSLGYIH